MSSPTASPSQIYAALVEWSSEMKSAHLRDQLLQLASPAQTDSIPLGQVMADVSSASSVASDKAVGLVTQMIQDVPSLARVLISVALIVLALASCSIYVRALRWGSKWGKVQGDSRSRAYFASGLGGFISGAICLPLMALFLMLVVAARKAPTSAMLSSTAFLAIILASSVVGALIGARSHYAGRAAMGIVGGFALANLLVASFHMTNAVFRMVTLVVSLLFGFIVSCIVAMPALSPSTSSKALCLLSSLSGAWLLASAIDLHKNLSFIDVQTLFLKANGLPSYLTSTNTELVVDWDYKDFKGLLAGIWFLTFIGFGLQLWLYNRAGEDPDTIFDAYLHHFIDSEKGADESMNGRFGVYKPQESFWTRLFSRETRAKRSQVIYDSTASPLTDMPARFKSIRHSATMEKDARFDEPYDTYTGRPTSLASYASSATLVSAYKGKQKEDDLRDEFDARSDIDEEEEALPVLRSQAVNIIPETGLGGKFKNMFGSSTSRPAKYRGLSSPTLDEGPTPPFTSLHSEPLSQPSSSTPPPPASSPRTLPIEATPSLVNALSRVAAAQREARLKAEQPTQSPVHHSDVIREESEGASGNLAFGNTFWDKVDEQALAKLS